MGRALGAGEWVCAGCARRGGSAEPGGAASAAEEEDGEEEEKVVAASLRGRADLEARERRPFGGAPDRDPPRGAGRTGRELRGR